MKILIKNNLAGQLSLDLFVDKKTPKVRATIPIGGTVDIGKMIGIEDLARCQQLQEMVADGDVTVTLEAETSDVQTALLPTQMFNITQIVAASAVIAMGGVSHSGTIVGVGAASIDVAAAGESMTIDVMRNGTTVLAAPIVLDNTATSRTMVIGALDSTNVQVARGDFLEASLTYVAGGAPTPITNTLVSVAVMPA